MTENFSKNQRGTALLEGAIVLPLVIVLAIISLDLLRLSFHALSMQYVAEAVLREAILPSATTADLLGDAQTRARGLGITLTADNVALCPLISGAPPCPTGTMNIGEPEDLIMLRIQLPMNGFIIGPRISSLFTRRYDINAVVIGKREPA
jgi:hypothetical protein